MESKKILTDINIEICHLDWTDPDYKIRADKALREALAIINSYKVKYKNVVVSMLIDDKSEKLDSDKVNFMNELLQNHPVLVKNLDYLVFESELEKTYLSFLEIVSPQKRQRVEKDVARWVKKNGSLACSHDISLWHTYRLGLTKNGVTIHSLHGKPKDDFFAKKVVSVLFYQDKNEEVRASTEVLAYLNKLKFNEKMVKRHYHH